MEEKKPIRFDRRKMKNPFEVLKEMKERMAKIKAEKGEK